MPLDPTSLLGRTPVIPVLTIESAAQAVPLARALVAGGLPVLEVTLRTAAALAAVKAITAEVPQAVVGVGTVTSPADIAKAVAAGRASWSARARPRRWSMRWRRLPCRRCPAVTASRARWRSPSTGSRS